MLRKKIEHKTGLAAVIGALVVSWFSVGYPALQATVVSPAELYNALPVSQDRGDQDNDGITDAQDATPFGDIR